MVKTLGVIFGAILLSIPIVYVDHCWGHGFLLKFFKEQAIGIVATVLALNIATITFLLGHLVSIENKAGRAIFINTRKEVKENVYFMVAMFVIMFAATAGMNSHEAWKINSHPFNPLILLALVTFILVFAALLEIVIAVFKATESPIDTSGSK